MNGEQFAFFNHQLAGMLRTGIPLEAALRQLCQGMGRGRWRREMEELNGDLERGLPLDQALQHRQLPPIYAQLLRVGAASNDLPGMLTLAADYFTGHHQFWTRFRAAMLYPIIVLLLALAVCGLMIAMQWLVRNSFDVDWIDPNNSNPSQAYRYVGWFSPTVIVSALALVGIVACVPRVRFAARWYVPGWKEGTLAQMASSMALLLRGGTTLPDALTLLARLEPYAAARREIEQWVTRLARGQTSFAEMTQGARLFPPLFVWLVAGAGEDLPTGFERAAELYRSRARYRLDLLLFALMPAAVILLGILLVAELAPFVLRVSEMFEAVGGP